jgi:hypothetical protein
MIPLVQCTHNAVYHPNSRPVTSQISGKNFAVSVAYTFYLLERIMTLVQKVSIPSVILIFLMKGMDFERMEYTQFVCSSYDENNSCDNILLCLRSRNPCRSSGLELHDLKMKALQFFETSVTCLPVDRA